MKRLGSIFTFSIVVLTPSLYQAQSVIPEQGTIPSMVMELSENQPTEWPAALPASLAGEVVITSIGHGDWMTPATWDCECIPPADADVVIQQGHQVTVNTDVSIVNLTIEEGALLMAPADEAVIIALQGDCECSGILNHGRSHVMFIGEHLHQLIGTCTFYDLTNEGEGDITLHGTTGIFGIFSPGAAHVTTNDMLIFRSSAGQPSGSLAPITAGQINGTITYERRIASTANGWNTLGAAVSDATINDINDDFITTGFPGSNFPANAFVSVRTYNESAGPAESAFLSVGHVNDALTPGLGYYVYANAGTYTFDVTGAPNTGQFIFPVTYTDHGDLLQDGLNVLANPYPSDVNWSKNDFWLKESINPALYIWDVNAGRFKVYSNGYATNGGTPIIRGGEAFWVHAFNNEASLRVTEGAKSLRDTPETNGGDQFVKLRMTGIGAADELIIAFTQNASPLFEIDKDAFKLSNDGATSLFASQSSDGIALAINHLPLSDGPIQVPIMVASTNGGDGVLHIQNIPMFTDRCAYIEDLVDGALYLLDETQSIPFSVGSQPLTARFMLHIQAPVSALPSQTLCYNDATGMILMTGAGDGPWDFTLFNSDGEVLMALENMSEPAIADGLPAGLYSVAVANNGICGTLFADALVEQPAVVEAAYTLTHIGCGETTTGTAEITADGGSGELSFLWNDDFTLPVRDELQAGVYTVSVMDENGCEAQVSFEITAAIDVEASFTVNQQIVNLQNGQASVYFTNTSEGAEGFTWNFGDGSALATDANPVHTYTTPGAYVVTLIAQNELCSDTFQTVVIVEQGVGIGEGTISDDVTVYSAEGSTIINFGHSDFKHYRIDAHNLLGQKLMAPIEGQFGAQRLHLNLLRNVPVALISIINTSNGDRHTYKILR